MESPGQRIQETALVDDTFISIPRLPRIVPAGWYIKLDDDAKLLKTWQMHGKAAS